MGSGRLRCAAQGADRGADAVNAPNVITLGRLLLVPITIWLILVHEVAAAFWVFAAAALSDGIDGFIAKRFDQVSDLGRFLDPLADKVLLVSVFIALGQQGYLPSWLVILVVSRDILIVGAFLFSFTAGFPFSRTPSFLGKTTTTGQLVLAGVVLAGAGLDWQIGGVELVLTYGVAAATIMSGGIYLVQWARTTGRAEDLR
ncbi:MAG: CDP-alcohol phosphatidyltransferase family protein [Proteobacteria bacterium]|nr:CDP-alcohol phosphatidyltransferase family protein [Pseudomonadota bacterium]